MGLNVDEKTKREAPRMGLKALAVRPAARQFFFSLTKFGLSKKIKRMAGPGPFRRGKNK